MKKTQKILSLALVLLIFTTMAACSAGKSSDIANTGMEMDASSPEAMPSPEVAGAPEEAQSMNGGFTPELTSSGGAVLPEKMIYTGSAEIETLEFDAALEKLNALIEQYDGYIQSSRVTGNDYYGSYYESYALRYAYYEIRIPSDKFATVTELLDTIGSVTHTSTNVENITAQYQDTEARLTVLRAQEKRYLELLDMAVNVEEVLNIEDYLSDVRYEIERLETQIRSWDSLVSYSTLSINISEVAVYTVKEETPYGRQLSDAFKNTLKGLGSFFKSFFKFLVGAFPVLVILAAITVPTILIARARSRKKKESAAENQSDRKQ